MLKIGTTAPKFDLAAHDGSRLSTRDIEGGPAVIVFYPKNNTPG